VREYLLLSSNQDAPTVSLDSATIWTTEFSASQFVLIASRQLVNGLFDPLAAFRNWHRWLHVDGRTVVMMACSNGLTGRSAGLTLLTIAYLMKQCIVLCKRCMLVSFAEVTIMSRGK
jgi:hypothetical protein